MSAYLGNLHAIVEGLQVGGQFGWGTPGRMLIKETSWDGRHARF
jgi:hypothetical protein